MSARRISRQCSKKIQKKPEEIPRIFWHDVRVRFGKNFCNRSCAIWPDCSERLAKKFGKKIQKKIRCAVSLKIRGGCRFFLDDSLKFFSGLFGRKGSNFLRLAPSFFRLYIQNIRVFRATPKKVTSFSLTLLLERFTRLKEIKIF